MKQVLSHAEVAHDLNEARDWYERRKRGLGIEFQAAVEENLNRIRAQPLRFARIHGEVRCARLKRFPYGVFFYIFREDTIFVLAVMHHARDPERWQRRL